MESESSEPEDGLNMSNIELPIDSKVLEISRATESIVLAIVSNGLVSSLGSESKSSDEISYDFMSDFDFVSMPDDSSSELSTAGFSSSTCLISESVFSLA